MLFRRRGQLKLPNSGDDGTAPGPFPGRFFVITYDRDSQVFILVVDDPERSTYDLGEDISAIRLELRRRGYQPGKVDLCIDYAREFGGAQYIPTPGALSEDRVIQLLPRHPPEQLLQFLSDDQDEHFTHLR